MTILQAILFSIMHSMAELFPVSSLGHSVIVPRLLHLDVNHASFHFVPLLIAMQLGTAAALLIFFWRDWLNFAMSFAPKGKNLKQERHLFLMICTATVPALIIGFILEFAFVKFLKYPLLTACFLIVNGIILFLIGRTTVKTRKTLAHIDWLDAAMIGSSQALALIPGISRTGAAMISGVLSGLSYKDSARFSFLLATPILIINALCQIPKLGRVTYVPGLPGLIENNAVYAGGVASCVIAYASLWFLTRYFKTHEEKALNPFAFYCWGAGTLVILAIISMRYFR